MFIFQRLYQNYLQLLTIYFEYGDTLFKKHCKQSQRNSMAGEVNEYATLHELFFRSAKYFPDNIAVVFSGNDIESVTYADLYKHVKNLSAFFDNFFSKNEVVAIYSHDCLHLPALILAVMNASAAFYPISTETQAPKVLETVNHHSIRYILVENGLIYNIMNLIESYGDHTKHFKVVNCNLLKKIGFAMLQITVRNKHCVVQWSKDLAYVMQTSGTTGHPKAVFVPHSCIAPNIIHLR